jgi:arylformamidase
VSAPAPIPFAHLSKAALDFELFPRGLAKDATGTLARFEAETAALDAAAALHVTRDVPYGPRERERLDLYVPAGARGCPCLVFIHGGFWQRNSKAGSGFAARALAAAGWATVGVGYTLAPEVRVRDIVAEIGEALRTLRRLAPEHGIDPGRVILSGHSAGGHLTAAVMAGMAGEDAARAVAGAVPISGVYDLAPVAASYVNDKAQLDADEVAQLSPLFARPAVDVPVHVLVGADESAHFQQQSLALLAAWAPHLSHSTFAAAPWRDHFDVLDELTDPASATFAALMDMAR